MMTSLSSTVKGQRHIMDVGPRSLANFGTLEEVYINDRLYQIFAFKSLVDF